MCYRKYIIATNELARTQIKQFLNTERVRVMVFNTTFINISVISWLNTITFFLNTDRKFILNRSG